MAIEEVEKMLGSFLEANIIRQCIIYYLAIQLEYYEFLDMLKEHWSAAEMEIFIKQYNNYKHGISESDEQRAFS